MMTWLASSVSSIPSVMSVGSETSKRMNSWSSKFEGAFSSPSILRSITVTSCTFGRFNSSKNLVYVISVNVGSCRRTN